METLDLTNDNIYYLFRQYAQGLQAYNHVSGEAVHLIAGQLTLAHVINGYLSTFSPDKRDATIETAESVNEQTRRNRGMGQCARL